MSVQTIRGNEGKTRIYKMAVSTTVVADTFLAFASGYVQPATSSTAELKLIARQAAVTDGSTNTEILCEEIDESTIMVVDTAGNTSQALVGTKIDLTDATKANQAATTTKVLYVVGILGAATDKKVICKAVSKDS